MLVLKHSIVALSLGAALVVPNIALACAPAPKPAPHPAPVTSHPKSNDKDNKATHPVKPVVKPTDHDTKPVVKSTDKDDQPVAPKPTCPPRHVKPVTPVKPAPTPTPGLGDSRGQVLSTATTPVVTQTAATLPVTGSTNVLGTELAIGVAAASAIAAFVVARRTQS